MSQKLLQIQEQIARLQRDERRLKVEAAEVIAKIRVAIEAYGFTPGDLFSDSSRQGQVPEHGGQPAADSDRKVKYADGHGNVWGGRGPRPIWLRTALAQGRSLEEFAVGRSANPSGAGARRRRNSVGGATKRVVAIKYQDGENAWSGRGSQPRWLREAIESGRTLEDFKV